MYITYMYIVFMYIMYNFILSHLWLEGTQQPKRLAMTSTATAAYTRTQSFPGSTLKAHLL